MQPAVTISKRDWLDATVARILYSWDLPLLKNKLIGLTLAAFLAACCLVRAYIGMDGILAYTHDAFVFLEGAWRIFHGQHSNVDFYSDHGPFMYLETSFGIWLAHGSPAGFGYAQVLAASSLACGRFF